MVNQHKQDCHNFKLVSRAGHTNSSFNNDGMFYANPAGNIGKGRGFVSKANAQKLNYLAVFHCQSNFRVDDGVKIDFLTILVYGDKQRPILAPGVIHCGIHYHIPIVRPNNIHYMKNVPNIPTNLHGFNSCLVSQQREEVRIPLTYSLAGGKPTLCGYLGRGQSSPIPPL